MLVFVLLHCCLFFCSLLPSNTFCGCFTDFCNWSRWYFYTFCLLLLFPLWLFCMTLWLIMSQTFLSLLFFILCRITFVCVYLLLSSYLLHASVALCLPVFRYMCLHFFWLLSLMTLRLFGVFPVLLLVLLLIWFELSDALNSLLVLTCCWTLQTLNSTAYNPSWDPRDHSVRGGFCNLPPRKRRAAEPAQPAASLQTPNWLWSSWWWFLKLSPGTRWGTRARSRRWWSQSAESRI